MTYPVCFIEEVGFCVSARTKRGRSLIGTSVYVYTRSILSSNVSVIADFINKDVNPQNKPISEKGEIFKEYILDLKRSCLEAGLECWFLLLIMQEYFYI